VETSPGPGAAPSRATDPAGLKRRACDLQARPVQAVIFDIDCDFVFDLESNVRCK
jgi:hypothetical protein